MHAKSSTEGEIGMGYFILNINMVHLNYRVCTVIITVFCNLKTLSSEGKRGTGSISGPVRENLEASDLVGWERWKRHR